MKHFARLFAELDGTTSTKAKVEALTASIDEKCAAVGIEFAN